jgi:hypothetical protein
VHTAYGNSKGWNNEKKQPQQMKPDIIRIGEKNTVNDLKKNVVDDDECKILPPAGPAFEIKSFFPCLHVIIHQHLAGSLVLSPRGITDVRK